VPLNALSPIDQALARDKREALVIAVRARWFAIAVLMLLMVYLNPTLEAIYYQVLMAAFGLIGWAHLHAGTVGRPRLELVLLFLDVVLVSIGLIIPNPFRQDAWPSAMQYHFGGIDYFYLLLSTAVLAYSWRTISFLASAIAIVWLLGVAWNVIAPITIPGLSERVAAALEGHPQLIPFLDPNHTSLPNRIEEVVVFGLVAATLTAATWRSNRLLRRQAVAERERSNLARYFSPNVVTTLAHNDTPLRSIRSQNVAVLFVDIVGFTAFADRHEPATVVRTLRDFLERMEREVFRHDGTLDKYLGDGLMATFGTPVAGANDAVHALRAGRAMLAAVDAWNRERRRRGEEPLAIGVGLHYGPVVTGDIGANRLELAVVGATVNIASRLEAQTRVLNVRLVASRDLVETARSEPDWRPEDEDGLESADPQMIRGVAEPVRTWVLGG
jgi:adenylate cyclase